MNSNDDFVPYPPAAITEAAADWIARCDRGLTSREAEEFALWEIADPRHSAELARLSAAWNALNTVDEIPEVMHLARELDDKSRHSSFKWYRTAVAGLGCAAAIAVVSWLGIQIHERSLKTDAPETGDFASYRVVTSTARRLTLADGTTVELKGDSVIEPAFTAEKRLVRLVQGEANFNVVKDPSRPFIVQADKVAVQAVGTTFNVRLDTASVAVLVTEGKVRVHDVTHGRSLLSTDVARAPVEADLDHPEDATMPFPLLGAGERVVIPSTIHTPVAPSAATASEIDQATGWRATQLVFTRTPLREAIAAFNSFNQRQFVLVDATLGNRKLGGTFRADNIDAFLWLLETGFEIKGEADGPDKIVLRSARQP